MRTRGAIPGCAACAPAWRRWGTWCHTSARTGSCRPPACADATRGPGSGLPSAGTSRCPPDLIGRDFTAGRPDEKWCGDITYVKTSDGWAYLATVIDLHSRKLIGWAIADHMRTSLVTAALDMAISTRKTAPGVVFHSDRGCQYTSSVFDEYCTENNIRRSLGRTGICYDNAVSESFFATYKKELIHTRPWPSLANLEKETSDWISNYYNPLRRHSTLGYLTPEEYELGYTATQSIGSLIRCPKKREPSTARERGRGVSPNLSSCATLSGLCRPASP